VTDQDQSATTPRLGARPLSRPLVDPGEPRAFGRPDGVTGPFLGSDQRTDQGEYTPTAQPPGPVLAKAFGRTALDEPPQPDPVVASAAEPFDSPAYAWPDAEGGLSRSWSVAAMAWGAALLAVAAVEEARSRRR